VQGLGKCGLGPVRMERVPRYLVQGGGKLPQRLVLPTQASCLGCVCGSRLHVLRRRDGVVPTVAAGGCAGVRIVCDLGCLGGRLACWGGAGGKAGGGKMIDGASAIVCIACYNMLQRCHCLALVAVLRVGVCVVLCALLACGAC